MTDHYERKLAEWAEERRLAICAARREAFRHGVWCCIVIEAIAALTIGICGSIL